MSQSPARPSVAPDVAGFAAPWEATAQALSQLLIDSGAITAREWTEALGAEIAAAADPATEDGTRHYRFVVRTLERVVAQKAIAADAELAALARAWEKAAAETPHGEPIRLKR